MHGVVPHHLDVQLPIEKFDINSMIKQNFVSNCVALNNLSYEINFSKKAGWRVVKPD